MGRRALPGRCRRRPHDEGGEPAPRGVVERSVVEQQRKLFPYLIAIQRARVSGSITMVSAASARAALPGTTALAGVNGAIERIVSPLAAELAPVRVNAVAPGVVDTPWWSFLPEEQRQAQYDAAADMLPAGRVGRPEDVAAAIRYVIGATYVTGTILPVDGGFTVA